MIIDHRKMRQALDGMYWDHGDFAVKLEAPQRNAQSRALSEFRRVLPSACWNYLALFEKLKATLVQVEMILRSVAPVGVSEHEFTLVSRFGQTASRLGELVGNAEFGCGCPSLEILHRCLTSESENPVALSGALDFLSGAVSDPRERAAAAFLYLLRQKHFKAGNEVTAALFMNGILLSAGFFPIVVKNRDAAEFKIRLIEFEQSGRASDIMHFLVMTHEREGARHARFSRQNPPKPPLSPV